MAPYTAAKGAVKNLTKGMCTDWARHGLQVNAIGPGYFATPLNQALIDDPVFDEWLKKRTPAGRWGRIEELQGAGDLPGFLRVRFRQWPDHLCRWRRPGDALT